MELVIIRILWEKIGFLKDSAEDYLFVGCRNRLIYKILINEKAKYLEISENIQAFQGQMSLFTFKIPINLF